MINQNRLSTLFKTLVEIDSESTNEKAVAEKIVALSKVLGGTAAFYTYVTKGNGCFNRKIPNGINII